MGGGGHFKELRKQNERKKIMAEIPSTASLLPKILCMPLSSNLSNIELPGSFMGIAKISV